MIGNRPPAVPHRGVRRALAAIALGGALAGATSGGAVASTYAVTLRGTASGNAFVRSGTLGFYRTVTTVGTQNGVNAREACLRSGFPAGVPSTGAIWLGTTSACFPTRMSLLDLAYVRVGSRDGMPFTVVQPDSRLQALHVNGWNARSSFSAFLYSPVSGYAVYLVSGTRVAGQISLRGFGGFGGWSTYTATLTGSRVS